MDSIEWTKKYGGWTMSDWKVMEQCVFKCYELRRKGVIRNPFIDEYSIKYVLDKLMDAPNPYDEVNE